MKGASQGKQRKTRTRAGQVQLDGLTAMGAKRRCQRTPPPKKKRKEKNGKKRENSTWGLDSMRRSQHAS
jgi:hypothetical protein